MVMIIGIFTFFGSGLETASLCGPLPKVTAPQHPREWSVAAPKETIIDTRRLLISSTEQEKKRERLCHRFMTWLHYWGESIDCIVVMSSYLVPNAPNDSGFIILSMCVCNISS